MTESGFRRYCRARMFFPSSSFFRTCFAAAVVLGFSALLCRVATAQQPAPVPAVDTSDRAAVIDLYHAYYMSSIGLDSGWTGSVTSASNGTTTSATVEPTELSVRVSRRASSWSSRPSRPDSATSASRPR